VLRTSAFETDSNGSLLDIESTEIKARKRYMEVRGENERLVSGSDDFSLILWHPESDKKPIARMTGHLQLINDIKYSPDSRLIASASFDKSIKLWDGKNGQ
jgi:ribosome assembly protein 4